MIARNLNFSIVKRVFYVTFIPILVQNRRYEKD